MGKIIFQTVLPAVMLAAFCSCVNINSFNKPEESGITMRCTQEQCESDECCGSVKTELYFGMLKPDGTNISEEEWQTFLEKSVSPVFEGFTVLDAIGQCKNAEGKIVRQKTKLLIVVREDDDDGSLEKVKNEFSKAFPKNAFFWVSYPVVSPLDGNDDDDDDCDGDDCGNDRA